MNEPVETVHRFVAWYLTQGADRIVIFFDNPDDPAIPTLAGLPNVECRPCTDAFWQSLGLTRDVLFTRRQNLAISHAYAQIKDSWLLNVDGDELLYFDGRSIAEAVKTFPDDAQAVRIQTAEAIQTEDTSTTQHFRLPMGRLEARAVYKASARLMARRRGLVGHKDGKSFTRAGLTGVLIRQHWASRPDGTAIDSLVLGPQDGAYLLHYIDAGYRRWRDKVEWRAMSSGFHPHLTAAVRDIAGSAQPEKGFENLYKELHFFDAARLQRLQSVDKHLALAIDPNAVAAEIFPEYAGKAVS